MHVRATSGYVTQDFPFDTSEIARSNKILNPVRCGAWPVHATLKPTEMADRPA
jgi:hypothetical protein